MIFQGVKLMVLQKNLTFSVEVAIIIKRKKYRSQNKDATTTYDTKGFGDNTFPRYYH